MSFELAGWPGLQCSWLIIKNLSRNIILNFDIIDPEENFSGLQCPVSEMRTTPG